MAYQSLYRRYRPQTFSAIRGQQHVVAALQGAVRDSKVGHAYLLHGPRGTGKTTSARVLAKALNCEDLQPDGEPCTVCESCISMEQGRSFDLHELDAASNNKVEDMRDLLAKVNLGTPGRAKVYLLDEAHMLTTAASNALLKTLEEPPDHVTWVLATTEPHKLVDTIRSRCQVFELGLLGADEMEEHVRWVVADAGLDVDDEVIDYVVAAGGGSVRDCLSALDRVVAAGGVATVDTATDKLLTAISERDAAVALAALDEATGRGRDPRTIGESAVAGLRDAFLTAMGSPPTRLAESGRTRAEHLASVMAPAAMTRALETLGTALVEMRQAPDPRVHLDVAVVRVCRLDTDQSTDALLERIERLERALVGRDPAAPAVSEAPSAQDAPAATEAPPDVPAVAKSPPSVPSTPSPGEPASPRLSTDGPAAAARQALAARKRSAGGAKPPAEAKPPAPPPVLPAAGREESVDLAALRPTTPTEVVELAVAHLGLAKEVVVEQARRMLPKQVDTSAPRDPADLAALWQALVAEHGVQGVVGPPPEPEQALAGQAESAPTVGPDDWEPPPDPDGYDEEMVHPDDLVDARSHTEDVIDQLTDAFPGAELITVDDKEKP